MTNQLITKLTDLGITASDATVIVDKLSLYLKTLSPAECWQKITREILTPSHAFAIHKLLYETVYPEWDQIPCPAWFPTSNSMQATNLFSCMRELGYSNYNDFHLFSHTNCQKFWEFTVKKLNIIFDVPYKQLVDLSAGNETPHWFPDARLNIVNSCFQAPADKIAIIYRNAKHTLTKITYGKLQERVNQVANSLIKLQFKPGDYIGVMMPMTPECIAIYLGIIKAGCIAVSIADSFAPDEIAARIRITHAKAVFTQEYNIRAEKYLPLYQKVIEANAPRIIVLPAAETMKEKLRDCDLSWQDFLSDNSVFNAISCKPTDAVNILFSSGTTGDPKAIPWDHTTPIKCASDAFYHLDIKSDDILAWPTNLGWMMGPWLVFAALLNQATIALYTDAPTEKAFGEFIQDAKVTMLGLVPSIIKAWHATSCMTGLDWSAIKLFSSSGECSNIEDMLYLMASVGYKPIIEYCGGTEIGGAYISGTLLQPAAPAAFTTPTLGLDLVILDEQGKPTNNGEVALIPPSIGLSTTLLNKDHHQVYYADMPLSSTKKILRRHGDQIEKFSNGFYRALGRADDTMNLGGIKTSSAEIERTLLHLENIHETAAIAINPPGGGPSQLVIYAVVKQPVAKETLKVAMQNTIRDYLNPLFKIHDIVIVDTLPRTASNKVMRRVLRDQYHP